MSVNVTASKLPLCESCPAAAALPAVWQPSTEDQQAGTARHRYLERAPVVGTEAALAEVDERWRSQCEAIIVDEVPVGTAEIAFAYDTATDTARVLGQWIGRAYDVSATEISGTADLVCDPAMSGHARWLVIDWKGDEEVESASTNAQLGFYALCVARVHQLDEVDVAIGYITHTGAIRWDRATLGPFELEAMAARLRAVQLRVETARALVASGRSPDVATGLHCRRCPAMAACPAMISLVRELDVSAQASVDEIVPTLARMSDAHAGAAWVRVKLLEEIVEAMKRSLTARAETRGLPLPDGSWLMPTPMPRRTVVMERALPVLISRFGAEQVEGAVEKSLSMETVTKLARQLAPGKGQKKAVGALLDALREAGALREKSFVQLRVKKAGAPAEEGIEP